MRRRVYAVQNPHIGDCREFCSPNVRSLTVIIVIMMIINYDDDYYLSVAFALLEVELDRRRIYVARLTICNPACTLVCDFCDSLRGRTKLT